MDEEGQQIRAHNSPGEIWIRGPTVVKGYLDNTEANTSSFSGEWFRTGDIAYCDEKTMKWYIVDRKKVQSLPCDMILTLTLVPIIGADQGSRLPGCTT